MAIRRYHLLNDDEYAVNESNVQLDERGLAPLSGLDKKRDTSWWTRISMVFG